MQSISSINIYVPPPVIKIPPAPAVRITLINRAGNSARLAFNPDVRSKRPRGHWKQRNRFFCAFWLTAGKKRARERSSGE